MTKQIELTKGYVALVDDADYELVSQWLWQSQVNGKYVYACRNFRDGIGSDAPVRKQYLHHFISDAKRVRFKDKNTLNCMRENLLVRS